MNTKAGKTFGLALIMAVGILAVMFALGTFSSQKAGADGHITNISISPTDPSPGANVEVKVTFDTDGPLDNFETVSIKLEGWGLPSDIEPRDVLLHELGSNGDITGDSGLPTDASISGGEVVIEFNSDPADDTFGIDDANGGTVQVVIRKRAGLTAPTKAGMYDVTVGGVTMADAVTVSASLKVDPKKGAGGTEITVTGKAFASGTGSLYSQASDADGNTTGDQKKLTSINVSNGSFSVTVTAKDLAKGDMGYSQLSVKDAEGSGADTTAMFQVTGTTTVSPESVDKGKLVKISLSDWIQALPDKVKIGGEDVPITDEDGNEMVDGNAVMVGALDDGAVTFYVKVSASVDLGTKTLVLLAGTTRLDSTSIEITSLPLTVVPTTAVAGQEITVEGTGFSGGDYVSSITVGGIAQNALSNGNLLSDEDRRTRATSSGRVVLTFMVPDGVTDGSKSVQVTDSTGRIGSVDLTVPEPAVTLDPASSRRGTTVVVTGRGFPAGESIDILYDGQREGSARSDSTGDWAVILNIPNNAVIGGSPDVEGNVVIGDVTYSAKAKHTVPGEEMTLSPEMARGGDTVTITGTGFPAYRPVSVKVGILSEINTGTNTDGNGDFSTSILLPALDVGTHLVQASVGDSSATKVLTVPSADMAAVTTATDVVFADLISADNLERVYHYVNATSTWLVFDPRPDFAEFNDYTETTGGQAVWVKVSDAAQFQGEPLFSGWNLIVLQ